MLDYQAENGENAIAMESQAAQPSLGSDAQQWSNRILIAAMTGILFLTCFPFRFLGHARLPGDPSPFLPFLLGKTFGKQTGAFDDFLNVLLFIPLGFGLSARLLEKGKSRARAFLVVWASGFVLSYAIELVQLYIPGRDSGWEDVITNSSGAAAGFLLFIVLGAALLKVLTRAEQTIESLTTRRRVAIMLVAYFACWFAFSVVLQKETKLTDWEPDARLLIGNDAPGEPAASWNGEVSKLEIWNRPLSSGMAEALTGEAREPGGMPEALVSYDFTGGVQFSDRMKLLPDLSWSLGAPARGDPSQIAPDNNRPLELTAPAAGLIADLRRTNQFAVHIICKPAEGRGSYGQIISISGLPDATNLTVRQEDTNLGFWFRTPLSARHAQLGWYIPKVFAAGQTRNILFSYDGSVLSVYIDGAPAAIPYRLGPGAALAHMVRRIRPSELDGYEYIYYALVFFPAGVVLGIVARGRQENRMAGWLFFGAWLIVPSFVFEYLLIAVSGRAFSPGSVALAGALSVFGAIWINADSARGRRAFTG